MTNQALSKASKEAVSKLISYMKTNELEDSLPDCATWLKF